MTGAGDNRPALPEEARDHLGRSLRTSLDADAPKPAYLGDPATPPEFEEQVDRLRKRLKASDEGSAAVEAALRSLTNE